MGLTKKEREAKEKEQREKELLASRAGADMLRANLIRQGTAFTNNGENSATGPSTEESSQPQELGKEGDASPPSLSPVASGPPTGRGDLGDVHERLAQITAQMEAIQQQRMAQLYQPREFSPFAHAWARYRPSPGPGFKAPFWGGRARFPADVSPQPLSGPPDWLTRHMDVGATCSRRSYPPPPHTQSHSISDEEEGDAEEYEDGEWPPEYPDDNKHGSECPSLKSENASSLADDDLPEDLQSILATFQPEVNTGPNLQPNIKALLQKLLRSAEVKEVLRPGNFDKLVETRVNEEVWARLSPTVKSADLKMQSIQKKVVQALISLSYVVDKLHGIVDTDIFIETVSCFSQLSAVSKAINGQRREAMKEDANDKLKKLCVAVLKVGPEDSGKFLFGDNLHADAKRLDEFAKIADSLAKPKPQKPFHKPTQKAYRHHPYPQRGRGGGSGRQWSSEPTPRGRGQGHARRRPSTSGQRQQPSGGQGQKQKPPKVTSGNICSKLNLSVIECSRQAARLPLFYKNWVKITSDKAILDMVAHCHIDIERTPTQASTPRNSRFTPAEHQAAVQEIGKLLKKGVLEPVQHCQEEFLSTIFLRPKKDPGSYRMILNLSEFNDFVHYEHFKMDTFLSVLNLIQPGVFMASIDVSDAYYTVSIAKEHRKFLRFLWQGKVYQFTCMPNGLSDAPRKFTKLLRPVLSTLQAQGHTVLIYIDDCFLQADSLEDCERAIQDTLDLFQALGFVISFEKSVLKPSHTLHFLGFLIDSLQMVVTLPDSKRAYIRNACLALYQATSCTLRQLASLTGTLVSSFPAVQFGKMHYRELEKAKSFGLKYNAWNFEACVPVTELMREELIWWVNNIDQVFCPISMGNPTHTLTTDASTQGWGAVFQGCSIGGRFNLEEATHHINYLELLAIFHGLRAFCRDLTSCHILVKCDNTTAIAYINKMGGCKSTDCNNLALEIWDWCIHRDLWLTATHIPGIENTEADLGSRQFSDTTEWHLKPLIFSDITKIYGCPEIDLFASRLNYQLDQFVSWRPDPLCTAVDAFTLNWNDWNYIYIFCPFSLMGKVVQKLRLDQAEALLILPYWPSQPWFSTVGKMLLDHPLILPRQLDLLTLPGTQELHPLRDTLRLLACRVSGASWPHRSAAQQLSDSYCPPGGKVRKGNMVLTYSGTISLPTPWGSIPALQI